MRNLFGKILGTTFPTVEDQLLAYSRLLTGRACVGSNLFRRPDEILLTRAARLALRAAQIAHKNNDGARAQHAATQWLAAMTLFGHDRGDASLNIALERAPKNSPLRGYAERKAEKRQIIKGPSSP